jgi:hypothetical protein
MEENVIKIIKEHGPDDEDIDIGEDEDTAPTQQGININRAEH